MRTCIALDRVRLKLHSALTTVWKPNALMSSTSVLQKFGVQPDLGNRLPEAASVKFQLAKLFWETYLMIN